MKTTTFPKNQAPQRIVDRARESAATAIKMTRAGDDAAYRAAADYLASKAFDELHYAVDNNDFGLGSYRMTINALGKFRTACYELFGAERGSDIAAIVLGISGTICELYKHSEKINNKWLLAYAQWLDYCFDGLDR